MDQILACENCRFGFVFFLTLGSTVALNPLKTNAKRGRDDDGDDDGDGDGDDDVSMQLPRNSTLIMLMMTMVMTTSV